MMMKKLQGYLFVALLFTASVAMGQQVVESSFGKGVYVVASDSSFSMKFNARVQSLLMFEAPSDNISMDGMPPTG